MKITGPLIIILLFVQCSCNWINNDSKNASRSTKNLIPSNTVFSGVGESGIAGYYNDWIINIQDSNYVEMLCSMKTDSLDTRAMNRQLFGRLIPSDTFSYRIIINKAIAVDDCDEPDYAYLDTDTIPFYIDSSLFKEIKFWDVKINNTEKSDKLFRIISTHYFQVVKDDKDISMTLYPDNKSVYYPVTIISGKKCQINILKYEPEMFFYINQIDDKFELITDHTPFLINQDQKCDYCIKRMDLKLIK